MSAPRTAVVGGGLLGLTAAYRLTRAGHPAVVYERAAQVGGLAASADLDGIPVDRFYHVVLPTDDRVRGLAGELGLADRFRFRRTGVGFYHDGRLASMSSLRELLSFPALRAVDRVRLGAFVARCQMIREHADLDREPLERWLRRMCGERLWEGLWRPLLDSKFDGRYDDLPATYLWARTRRMSRTRDRTSHEVMGTIDGGYQMLADALADAIRAAGGEVRTETPVRRIAEAGGRAVGVVTDSGLEAYDQVLSTLIPPQGERLLPPALAAAAGPDRCRYLGVVCLVMRLRRSISPYYALNLTDRRVALTTVVETTHVVNPERVGGTLIYAPRYVNPDAEDLERSSLQIRRDYLRRVQAIFPSLRDDDVLAMQVARSRVAEPVHVLGHAGRPADLFPAPGLALASTAQIYPELVNGQAVVGVADRVAEGLIERLDATSREERAA